VLASRAATSAASALTTLSTRLGPGATTRPLLGSGRATAMGSAARGRRAPPGPARGLSPDPELGLGPQCCHHLGEGSRSRPGAERLTARQLRRQSPSDPVRRVRWRDGSGAAGPVYRLTCRYGYEVNSAGCHSAGIRTGVLLLLTVGVLAARGAGIGSCRLADHELTMLEPSWGGTVAAAPRMPQHVARTPA
jgi:hypothetical protein